MKIIKIIALVLLTIVAWLAVNQYFFCPFYTFSEPRSFEGNQLYNPYQQIDSGTWYKCNFHAHSNAWNGMTNGEGNAEAIWNNYDSMGYAVHCVSEYQKIDDSYDNRENYIPAYEHGYNCRKTHQLVLGDEHVTWLDYFFPQTLSNKQHILNRLKENENNVVILNHPELKKGYNPAEIRYLSNYQCMEVLNPSVTSFAQWDAALSAGYPVFIVGNDDAHRVNDLTNIGRECTWLNCKVVNKHNILTALKTGQGYAMHIPEFLGESTAERINRIKDKLPSLEKFTISHDTINITMSKQAKNIVFSGQNGRFLAAVTDTSSAFYCIKKEDHYVRASIRFEDGTVIFLNPVFRYSGDPFYKTQKAVVNRSRTILFFLLGLNIMLLWVVLVLAYLFADKWKSIRNKRYIEDIPVQYNSPLHII